MFWSHLGPPDQKNSCWASRAWQWQVTLKKTLYFIPDPIARVKASPHATMLMPCSPGTRYGDLLLRRELHPSCPCWLLPNVKHSPRSVRTHTHTHTRILSSVPVSAWTIVCAEMFGPVTAAEWDVPRSMWTIFSVFNGTDWTGWNVGTSSTWTLELGSSALLILSSPSLLNLQHDAVNVV